MHFKKLMSIMLALALVLVANLANAETKEIRLVMGAGWTAVAPEFVVMKDFLAPEINKRLKAKTDYQIKWVQAFGNLVKPGEGLEGCQNGILDVAYVSPPFEPTKLLPLTICYYLPFSTSDPVLAARSMMQLFEKFPALKDLVEKKYNQKFIGNTIMGSYELLTKFPVENIEQLKGRKIAGAGPNLQWVKAVGAVPVQSSLPEAYTSLQTGVYEGWIMTPGGTAGFKLYEPAKYYTLAGFGAFMGGIITVNLDRWNSLPKEVQDVFLEVGREYTVKLAQVTKDKVDSDLDKMRKGGCTVSDLSQAEKDKWAAMMPNFAQKFAQEVSDKFGMPGKDMVDAYYQIQKDLGHRWPKDWTK